MLILSLSLTPNGIAAFFHNLLKTQCNWCHQKCQQLGQSKKACGSLREAIPDFPSTMSGYRSQDNKDFWNKPFPVRGSIRLFEGNDWQGIPKFPSRASFRDIVAQLDPVAASQTPCFILRLQFELVFAFHDSPFLFRPTLTELCPTSPIRLHRCSGPGACL
jgi:hypothetical protein